MPTNTYTCADGIVYIAIVLDAHWRALCAVMGRDEFASAPGFATNVERIDSRDAVNAMIGHYCAGRPAAEVVADLNAAGVVVAKVNSYAEAAAEPHIQARGMLQPVTLTDGTVQPLTAPAAKFSRTPTSIRRPAPRPGAQTDEVLDAFAEIAALPGVSIGSHGATHTPLTQLDARALENELLTSKRTLEDITGRAITSLSYPHGAVDRRVRDAAAAAGYAIGASSRFDINAAGRDPLLLCRTDIHGNDSLRVFNQKLNGDWDWYRWRNPDPALI